MLLMFCKRVLQFILVLLSVSFISFSLTYIAPGDPASMKVQMNGDSVSEELLNQMREEMGLTDSFLVQYGRWLSGVLRGDLGTSYKNGHSVSAELSTKMKNTIFLALVSFVVLVVVSFPLGIISAVYQNRWLDYLIRFVSFFGISIPNFWLGLVLMYYLGVMLHLLPIVGEISVRGMVMPVITVAVQQICTYIRQIRAAILEEMNMDYVRGLRTRGIPKKRIILHHVLPNSLTGIITLLGISAGTLLAGTAIIEQLFSWPGIGKWALEAIAYQDYPVIQGYVLVVSAIYVSINLIVDIIVGVMNPRQREGAQR